MLARGTIAHKNRGSLGLEISLARDPALFDRILCSRPAAAGLVCLRVVIMDMVAGGDERGCSGASRDSVDGNVVLSPYCCRYSLRFVRAAAGVERVQNVAHEVLRYGTRFTGGLRHTGS